MYTVTVLAAPTRADLTRDRVDALRDLLGGQHTIWLADEIAAEFPTDALPEDAAAIAEDTRMAGFDLVIQPTLGRRKAVLLADMDSTMIQQECIDELAAVAGVGERVAAITAQFSSDSSVLAPMCGMAMTLAWFSMAGSGKSQT